MNISKEDLRNLLMNAFEARNGWDTSEEYADKVIADIQSAKHNKVPNRPPPYGAGNVSEVKISQPNTRYSYGCVHYGLGC